MQKIVFDHEGHLIVYKKDDSTHTIDISAASRIFFSTPEAVGIEEVTTLPTSGAKGIYDLTGHKILAKAQTELPRGIYIIDGKKTQVK